MNSIKIVIFKSVSKSAVFSEFVVRQNAKPGPFDPHIHETGWLSGVVYLKIPDNQLDNDGIFNLGLTVTFTRTLRYLSEKILDLNEGDIVLFPPQFFIERYRSNQKPKESVLPLIYHPHKKNEARLNRSLPDV